MSLTQFAMVQELASIVKDNLRCKHLVLSFEEAFVNFLEDDDSSSDGVLKLEPMNAYERRLLHHLAEIFGFYHHSVGEGDDRHLILERCPETSIPAVLVSDLLWQYDDLQQVTSSYQVLRSNKTSPGKKIAQSLPITRNQDARSELMIGSEIKTDTALGQLTLEEREAAYAAARERIFAGYESEMDRYTKQKPRVVPVVARRMISHALGQRLDHTNKSVNLKVNDNTRAQNDEMNLQQIELGVSNLKMETYQQPNILNGVHKKKIESKPVETMSNTAGISRHRRMVVDKASLKDVQIGAAKRMFAHALGFSPVNNGSQKSGVK